MERYNCYCARWCALCTLVTQPKYSMFMFLKAFAVARSATTDVPHTSSIPSARTSRRYLQSAFVASGRLHCSTLHLLRAYASVSHLPLTAQTRVNLASQRFLLPRLTQSALARRSLKAHQSDLLANLTASLHDFKGAQKVAYADLPHPDPWEEVVPWRECKSLGDIALATESGSTHPPYVTLLRCALADLAVQSKPSTADDIFQILFSTNLPSLLNIDSAYQVRVPQLSSTSQTTKRLMVDWSARVLIIGVAVEDTQ